MGIGKLWAGKLYGTNTGNLFVELSESDGQVSGTIRFSDDRVGLVIYSVTGTFNGTMLELRGDPVNLPDGVEYGQLTVQGTLTAEGQIRGQWSTTIGSGGTYVLLPHDLSMGDGAASGLLPERMHTAVRTLGAVRLYSEDVRELIGFLSKDFSQGRVVVTYRERGNEISRYASDFQSDESHRGELKYLKLLIQEPEAYGINRVAVVELSSLGVNEVRTQGVQESWVIGKAESVASFLRMRQKTLATTFRTFGLNLNGFIALGALVALPELTLGRRIVFVALIAIISWLIGQAHTHLIPNFIAYFSPRRPSALERTWPQILSWLIAATSALIASIAYGLLKGELSWLSGWLLWPW